LKDALLETISTTQLPIEEAPESSATEATTQPEVSLVEFVNEKQPETHPDRVITIAAFLYKYRGVELFTSTDIEACYSDAFLKKSSNYNRDINANRKKGLIADAHEKKEGRKAFRITQKGLQYVEQGLVTK
jgi:hypothetical protein